MTAGEASPDKPRDGRRHSDSEAEEDQFADVRLVGLE